jgi:hypothetical protein
MFWTQAVPKSPLEVEPIKRKFDTVELPDAEIFLASVTHILARGLGYKTSSERRACVLGDGRPVPMMSYGLVEYMLGLDLSALDLLELGGGGSTQFWAGCARSVVTFETNPDWLKSLQAQGLRNVEARLSTPDKVASDVVELGRKFDAIVIDLAANRCRLAKRALEILKPGGFVILDNSDWYPNASRTLREGDLIQVDFHDFRPLHHFRCTTSLFMHREFRPKPRAARLPLVPIGGKDLADTNQWDRP